MHTACTSTSTINKFLYPEKIVESIDTHTYAVDFLEIKDFHLPFKFAINFHE